MTGAVTRAAGLAGLLLFLLLVPAAAQAGQVELYGASVRSAGLAGGGWALEDGASALAVQPAALGPGERDRFRIHYLGGNVWLDPVTGVTRLDGEDGAMPRVTIQPQVLAVDFAKGIGPWFRAGAQVSMALPWLYSHETKDPWVPYSMRWQNRIARSVATVGFSARLPVRGIKPEGKPFQGGLWFGFGLSVGPRGIIEVDLDLEGVAGGLDGTSAVEATLSEVVLAGRYRIRPQFSLLLDFGTFAASVEGLRLGVAYSPEARTDISPIHLDVAVLGLGEVNAVFSLVDRLQAEVALGLTDFYDPHELRISLALDRPRFALSADVRLGFWSGLAASYGQVVSDTENELTVAFASGTEEVFPVVSGRYIDSSNFRDTVEVTLGGEGRVQLPGEKIAGAQLRPRGGFRYIQGVVRPNDGPLATIDGDALTASIGVGLVLPLRHSNERLGPLELDWALQGTRLLGQDLPKTAEGVQGVRDLPVEWESDARWPGGWVLVSGGSVGISF